MYTVRLKAPLTINEKKLSLMAELFDHEAFSILHENQNWVLEWLCSQKPDINHIPAKLSILEEAFQINLGTFSDIVIEKMPDKDWLADSYQTIPAFAISSFFVCGSEHQDDIPHDKIGLKIDAKTAFGSGKHPTTAGCLRAMEWLKDQGMCPWHVLDMGTGSGILAIAAWKLWKTPVLAVDCDPDAIRLTESHRILNKIPEGKMNILTAHGEGFNTDIVKQRAPYELIIANILAGSLKEMAGDLKSVLDDGGRVILSGILNEKSEWVRNAYSTYNLEPVKKFEIDDWVTLILQH